MARVEKGRTIMSTKGLHSLVWLTNLLINGFIDLHDNIDEHFTFII